MKISLLVPTRNRPEKAYQMAMSALITISDRKNLEILMYLDLDDPSINKYRNQFAKLANQNVELIVGQAVSVSKSWNDIASRCTGDVLMMGNDDQIFVTPRWDITLEKKVKQYPDNIYCAWFNDGINGPNHCAFPIVSRKWYNTLGYFTPGIFQFGYNDTWIFDIAKKIDRCLYIPEVLVEHRHFSVGKSQIDDTYARNRTQERGNLYAKDRITFACSDAERGVHAEKLKKVMEKK